MFCVECGKEKKLFKNGVCLDCYIENNSFSKGPEVIDIISCPRCNSYKYKNTWKTEPFEATLKRFIKDIFYISGELKRTQIKIECNEKGKQIKCKIIISGSLDDKKVEEQHFLEVHIKRSVCDVCSKRYGGYFEAVLQIRADKRKLTREEIKNIKLEVKRLVEDTKNRGNRGLFITDIAEEHDGIDFYLSEKGIAYDIAKKIQRQYGGIIKRSSKNIGMKDSRQIYRMTYLIRLPSYKEGDFILFRDSFFQISTIVRNKVHAVELSNWVEQVFDSKELRKVHMVGGKESIKEMILVSQTQNEIQAMDPKSYKIVYIKKPKKVSFDSTMIKLVKLEEHVFLLPKKNAINK